MGVCDSASKVLSTTNAIASTTNAVVSLKDLINNNTQKFTEITSSSFDKYDKDKSGYIEYSELKEVINDMAKQFNLATNVDEDLVKKAFESLDTNKDGKLSKEEFTQLTKEKLLAL